MRKPTWLVAAATFLLLLSACGGGQEGTSAGSPVRTAAVLSVPAGADADYEQVVQQLYVGYFGRAADPAGLAFFTQAFRAAGVPPNVAGLASAYATNGTVRSLLDAFAGSAESRQLYPACDWVGCDFTWVLALYRALFSRDSDADGAQFWVDALRSRGATRATVLLSVLGGARGTDAELVARKVGAAVQFTRTIDAAGKREAYSGQLPGAIVRAMLQNLPGYADQAAVQAQIEATIDRLGRLAAGTVEEVAPGTRKIVLLASGERMLDNGERLSALADALAKDLNQLRQGGPVWSVAVLQAAGSVAAIRAQLRGMDGAILVGRVPVPTAGGAPFLDVYRLPDCPGFQVDEAGQVANALAPHPVDPRCQNGLVLSILRGTTTQAEGAEVAAKLDQFTAYHKASGAANARWTPRFRMIEAGWFGGPQGQWGDLSPLWDGTSLFPAAAISYLNAGTAAQRRDAFLDCLAQDGEICTADVHGSPEMLSFEGPGVLGQFYSSDIANWYGADLPPQFVKAKYVELASCSSQDFLAERSVGTSLLMRGQALLTRGTTTVTGFANTYEEDLIRNEYVMLQTGSTFAETLYGRMEGTPTSIQGDPWITMRPVPAGPQPRLVIDGRHYNGGVQTVPVTMPDAAGGASAMRVLTFSNRGNADLHVRIGSMFAVTGLDDGTGKGVAWEPGYNAQYDTALTQFHSDGRVLAWPDVALEQNGSAMPVTLRPGESIAITYNLKVQTGADGKPKQTGVYTGQLMITSDDPGSRRIYLAMEGRVR